MTKTIKNRFFCLLLATIVILGMIPATNVSAYSSSGGGYSRVMSTINVTISGHQYQLDPGEGVTVLSKSGNSVYIEFNTLDGPRQAFVSASKLEESGYCYNSVLGTVCQSGSTYYSPDKLHYAGSVSYGENVAVLCHYNGWVYIEYNVANAMRKRAFIPDSYIDFSDVSSYNNIRPLQAFYHTNGSNTLYYTYSYTEVYSGPNGSTYATCGSVDSNDNGSMYIYASFRDRDNDLMYYISYETTYGTKYGYVYA